MIELQHDIELEIAVAPRRFAKKWTNKRYTWQDLVNRCSRTKRTEETIKQYLKMSRDEQANIKDVGGFVGGFINGGARKTENITYRTLATLDIDYGTPEVWDEFTSQYACAALLYSTHKHTQEKPRYRLVIPFNRHVTPQEYEPICRRIAYNIGIELFDITTYQLPRLFYWPSTSKNGDFVFEYQDGLPLNADEMLGTYIDWRNCADWPTSLREGEVISREIRKVGDPMEKPGLIGAFCRSYTIEEVIETMLSDVYEPTTHEGRYTYRLGSVAAGLVCYEGKFAYSNHETDPASRMLCNAWDLVRIHKFGHLDEGSRITDINKLPSQNAMGQFAAGDDRVKKIVTSERLKEADDMFANVQEEPDDDWMQKLDLDKSGHVKTSAKNIICVLENDPALKGHLWHNEFTGFDSVRGGLPWNPDAKTWGSRDDANLRIYFEERYAITGKDRIKDAKDAVLTKHRFHPVREYLEGLKWDGTPRLDTLLIDYLGADDNELTRAMTRKHFTAAVYRVMQPGCKYDYCLIFTGAEGIGKSTLLNVMGGEWYSDSLTTMEGKTGMESLRGAWIIELGELSSIKRSDVESVKSFITRQIDTYRAAYDSVVEPRPRQCIFCGTTNENYFLKGDTGNRRFWVVNVRPTEVNQTEIAEAIRAVRDQVWAEAVVRYNEGEKLYLPKDLEKQARERQQAHNDDADDPLRDLLQVFLDKKLPSDWATWDIPRRRAYFNNSDPLEAVGVVQRERVCVAEFICEQMQRNMADKEYKYLARRIVTMLNDLPGWEKSGTSRHAVALYGVQRSWKRVVNPDGINDNEL